ncbi:hypothetical protein LCGC14_2227780 [marine sediment metagenome]|uniref:Uncharacterized protein n=1 Tax=marine sediment metagenome TaxID=412755 RepID=A0A0F9D983_9ZZZZ
MTTDTKRTRLDGAFAQMPKVVRKSYVTVADVKRLRKYSGKKGWLVQIAEWCNRYCHTADQPGMKKTAYHIGAALREQYGEKEATKCLHYAGEYRDIIPSELWAKGWFTRKDIAVGRPGSGHHKNNKKPFVVAPRLDGIAILAHYDERYQDVNRQLYEVRGHLGELDRQMESRATPGQIRGLTQKALNDQNIRFAEKLEAVETTGKAAFHNFELLSRRHDQLEQRYRNHAFTDAWQRTITELRRDVTAYAEAINILRDDATLDRRIFSDHILRSRASRVSRHLPNPLRPLIVLAHRLRLAVSVLVRGQNEPSA